MKKKKVGKTTKKTPMPKSALPWVKQKESEVKRIWWYVEMTNDCPIMYGTFLTEHEASIVFKGKPKYGKTSIEMVQS